MPIENIRFVITGANPQTKTAQVNVDPIAGTATTSLVLSGVNSGTDTVQAFMDSQSLSSNVSQINWQQTNGPLSLGPTTINFYTSSGGLYSGTGSLKSGGPHTGGNSLVFNELYGNSSRGIPGFPITGFSTTNGETGASNRSPFSQQQQSSAGVWTSDVFFNEAVNAFDGNYQGNFVAAAAGTYTFYFTVDDSWVMFMGGGAARDPLNTTSADGSSVISKANLPWMGGRLSLQNNQSGTTDRLIIDIPSPGVYPYEIGHSNQGVGSNATRTYLMVTYVSGVGALPTVSGGQYGSDILPVSAIQSIPPASSTSGFQLALTPSGGATNLLVQGSSITLTLQLSGIVYKQKPYVALLEGVPGYLSIFNSPTANTFTLPTFSGTTVDPTAAASAIFSLSGDNASYKNRVSIAYDGTNYNLVYNGAAFDSNIDRTNITVTDSDIAWYNPVTKSFDLFSVTGQGGGSQASIEFDYLVSPTIGSISPNSLAADGSSVQFLVSLVKPMHPFQANTNAVFSGTGGISVTGSVANVNSSGHITGWTVTATVPVSSTNTTGTIVTTLSGTVTYLSGSAFVTNTVTYLNAVSTTINFTGVSTSHPSNYAFSVVSGGQSASTYGFGSSTTLTATVACNLSNFGTATFKYALNSGSFSSLGTASPTNVRQAGSLWLADYSLVASTSTLFSTDSSGNPYIYEFGYTETQADGGSVNYVDSNSYSSNNVNPSLNTGGSEGGGGSSGGGRGNQPVNESSVA